MARNTFRIDETLDESSVFKLSHLLRLGKYIRPYKRGFILSFLCTVASSAVGLLAPFLTMLVIDEAIPNGDIRLVLLLSGFMLVAIIVNIFFLRYRIMAMAQVGQSVIRDLRLDVFKHLQLLPFAYFDSRPHGKILVRAVNYINSLSDMLSNGILNAITDMLSLVIIFVMMLIIDVRLTAVAMAGMPVLFFAIFFIRIKNRKAWQIISAKQSNMNAYIYESIAGVRITQSFSREKENQKIFSEVLTSLYTSWMRGIRIVFFMRPTVENISSLAITFLYVVAVGMISGGSLAVGVLVAFIMYIHRFWTPINNIAMFYNSLVTNMSYLELIFETLDEPVLVKDSENASPLPQIKGNVEFKDVSFSYEDGQPVLENVSFSCEAGSTVALVGPTGAGKTTIVNLLSRFYETNGGEILIDGFDISHATLASLRSQMGIMLQDSFLFSGTIMENIRYSRLEATDEQVIAAAKAVCAHDFIIETEKGYKTEVNERGSRLSVGQRQLISFARALLADPRILILDEATANIDTRTEKALQEGLERLLRGRTSFIIAHRLSTIKHADLIMYVEHGKVAEAGTHEELMGVEGAYFGLVVGLRGE
ncbi:MAG: ABC transporter ATP-binding protein/permease [Defluviitaleaceae bacterium]|nr:ABC transporter ATP-binding protein/permease [Defluviitaleaceae bacterium]